MALPRFAGTARACALRTAPVEPDRREAAFAQALVALSQLAGRPRPLPELLAAAARVMAESLQYRTVCVNLVDEVTERLRVVAVHGAPAARASLEGTRSTWKDWAPLLEPRFERDGVFFVPAGEHDWAGARLAAFVPDLEHSEDPRRWHPEDALVVPLRNHDGHLLGIVSVDEPASGLRPDGPPSAALAAMSAHVGHAIASRRAADAAAARAQALEALLGIDAEIAPHGAQRAIETLLAEAGRALAFADVRLVAAADRGPEGSIGIAILGPDGTITNRLVAARPHDGPLSGAERTRLLRMVASRVQSLLHSAAHRALERSEARKDAVVRASLDAIVTLDAAGRIIDFNPAAERTFGFDRAAALGRAFADLALPCEAAGDLLKTFAEELAAQAAGAVSRRIETTARRAGGERFPCEVVLCATEGNRGEPLFTVYLRDVSLERSAAEALRAEHERARHAVRHDALTGVLSRQGFEEELAALLEGEGPPALVGCVDIADFGAINEAFGTEVGDRVLVEVAALLARLSVPHALLARTGSDEFTLAARPAAHELATLAEIRDGLAEPLRLGDGVELHLRFSAGLVQAGPGAGAAVLLKQAKSALRRAKVDEGGVAWFTPGRDRPGADLALVADLRDALRRDEFELHYQPLCRVGDGAVLGYEALLRWRRPDGALVPPLSFIGLAESSGLIEPIGAWVIGEACAQLARWDREGRPECFVSVNVSPRQFRRPDFVAEFKGALDAHGVAPQRLMIEVTESTMMSVSAAERALRELDALGVRCAIDDFGADYSSLGRLASLPVKLIKLDRSFLAGVPEDPRAARVASAILELCHSLGLQSVAEGVETEAQLDFLSARATLAQGFLLGRPLPPSTLRPAHIGGHNAHKSGAFVHKV